MPLKTALIASANPSFSPASNSSFTRCRISPRRVIATALTLDPPKSIPIAYSTTPFHETALSLILSLAHAPATVNRHHLARDETRFITHQPNRGSIQILRLPDSAAIQR